MRWIRPDTRYAIYERDGFVCVWCGEKPDVPSLDHLFPRGSRFRDNHPRRIVTACLTCNRERSADGVAAYLRRLRDQGFDVGAAVRRLRIARCVPVNRRAGQRARVAEMVAVFAPLPPLPDWMSASAGGVPA